MTTFSRWLLAAWNAWHRRAAVSVIDQGVLSGANFAANVLLARWLSPSDYGTYAASFSLALFVQGPYTALFIEPLSVLGATRYRGALPSYLRKLLLSHGVVVLPVAAGFFVVGHLELVPAAAALGTALALTIPFLLLTGLLRALCYLESKPYQALLGSTCFATTLLVATVVLHGAHALTPSAALLTLGAAHLSAALVMLARHLAAVATRCEAVETASALREHWSFGRPILIASLAASASGALYLPTIGAVLGAPQAAVLRTLQLLVTPFQQLLVALSTLALPRLAQETARRGTTYLRRAGAGFILITVGSACVYGLVLTALERPLLSSLIGSYYEPFAWGVVPMSLFLVLQTLANALGVLARVQTNPNVLLLSKVASLVVLVAFGLVMIKATGLQGALWALPLMAAFEAAVLALSVQRWFRHPPTHR